MAIMPTVARNERWGSSRVRMAGGVRFLRDVEGTAYPSQSGNNPQAIAGETSGEAAQWVVFALDAGRYALPLHAVERTVRAVQVTPLPIAPSVVLGAIDIQGSILPVFNLRLRFGLPQRPVAPADQFLIARTAHRTVALAVDAALGVIEHPASSTVDAKDIAPNLKQIRGVIPLADGMVLIHDLEQFLSAEEARALDEAMSRRAPRAG